MGIFTFFPKLYHKVIKIGITEDLGFGEKLRIEMCNLFIFISFFPLVLHFFYNLFGPNELREYILPMFFFLILGASLLLNHYQKYMFAKLNAIIVPLLLVGSLHVSYGWGMRVDIMYLLFLLFSLYFFRPEIAFFMGVLIMIIYTLIASYLSNYGPVFNAHILPSAPFGYFFFASISGTLMTAKLLYENYQYNKIGIEQNRILASKNEELERFNYIASHDLKSPLRNIHSFAGLLERDLERGEAKDLPEYLDFIKANAKHMSGLINDILAVSKINKEGAKEKDWVDLNSLLDQVKENLLVELEGKSVQVNSEELPKYLCNESQFSVLFQNLIQNGIKYNEHPKPCINIWSREEKGELQVYFQDNGIGIEEEYHDYIFEYFKRLHTVDEYEGTGIGLGLCKKIVESYEGEISLSSEKDVGSVFMVKLPLTNT